MNRKYLLLILLIFAGTAAESAMPEDCIFRTLWFGGAEPVLQADSTWKQSGIVEKPFEITCNQAVAALNGAGYVRKNSNVKNISRKKTRIDLWEKGNSQIIIMIVSEDIARTHFSWGRISHAK